MKLNKEIDSIEIFTSSIENELIKKRVKQVLEWNMNKAISNKKIFYRMSISLLILNASIPIINQLDNQSILVTCVASLCTIITGIITLLNFKDEWYQYRTCTESIKRECMMLNCRCGEYESEEREKLFLIKFEQILLNERTYWEKSKFNDNILDK